MKTKEEIIKLFTAGLKMKDEEIFSNDIKKGDLIFEANGWYGEMMDNKKGNTRMVNIHGFYTEAGSIYVWKIREVCKNGKIYNVELTDRQKKDKQMVEMIGF
jgi:hypothetical protein